jgi:acetyltransferase-like isoleucine patch superfamily enzyme
VLKPPEFMQLFSRVGQNVQVFANALILKPEAIALGDHSRLDDFCRLEGGAGLEVGSYVHVSSFSSIFGGGRCVLGDIVGIAQGARVITGSERPDAAMSAVAPAEWRSVDTTTVVLDHLSFLGTNAVMLPGTSLGIGAVIAAGSIVTKAVPPWEIWAGVPARALSDRPRDALSRRGVPVDELETRALLPPPDETR